MMHQEFSMKDMVGKIPLLRGLVEESQEFKYTRATSKNLIALYRRLSNPDRPLEKFDLYALVAANHLNCDIESGYKIVTLAEESFASWPTDRPVKFRDIVHYILIHKNRNYHKNRVGWDDAYKEIIEDIVPHNL